MTTAIQPKDPSKMVALTKRLFHAAIKRAERIHNAGCITQYRSAEDETDWFIAGHRVGVTDGPIGTGGYYFLVADADISKMGQFERQEVGRNPVEVGAVFKHRGSHWAIRKVTPNWVWATPIDDVGA